MSYRGSGGGYRGSRGWRGGRDDSYRGGGGGGGFKKFGGSSNYDYDRKPSFKGDGFDRSDRGDFRKSYQDDFRDDGYNFMGRSSPKRYRESSYGGDRPRKDFSRSGDSLDRGDYPGLKMRGSRGGRFRGSGSWKSSRGGALFRRGGSGSGSFTTRSGFISKRRDFPRKYSGSSSRREYVGRIKPSRSSRSKYEDGDDNRKSDDEIEDDEEEIEEEEEYVEEEVEEEEEIEDDHENLIEDSEQNVDGDTTKDQNEGDRDEQDPADSENEPGSKLSPDKKVSAISKKKTDSSANEGETKKNEEDGSETKAEGATSKESPKVKKKIVKKVIKVAKKKSPSSSSKSQDKMKEKSKKTSDGNEGSKGAKDEGESSDEEGRLTCPHCSFSSSHIRVYQAHLKSKSHLLVMNRLLARNKRRVLNIRMAQRKKQVFLDRECRGMKLSTFNCFVCKLNYRTLKLDHVNSSAHKLLKRILMPECKICNLKFKTSVLYDAHICSIRHLRKKGNSTEDYENDDVKDDECLEELFEEEEMLDPSVFMVLDAAESGDDENGDALDSEGKPKEKKPKPPQNLGADFIKKVEVHYCELCDYHLTKPSYNRNPMSEEDMLISHCREGKHLDRYYRHQQRQRRKEEQQKAAEAKLKEKKEKKKSEKEVEKNETENQGEEKKQEGKKVEEVHDEEDEEEDGEGEMMFPEDEDALGEEENEDMQHEEEEEDMNDGENDNGIEDDEEGNMEADSDLADIIGQAEEEMAAENEDEDNGEGTDKPSKGSARRSKRGAPAK